MNWQDVLDKAHGQLGLCRACSVCNGRACGNTIPGPGAKGEVGDVARRNFEMWQQVRVQMDTLHESVPVSCEAELFGRKLNYPVFAGPVGAVAQHYCGDMSDGEYDAILVPGCKEAGIAAMTGDGLDPANMRDGLAVIAENGGCAIPTVKPWDMQTVHEKLAMVREAQPFAVAMDIDAAGLPFLKNQNPPAGAKSAAELAEIVEAAGLPFIVKGIMTPRAAAAAVEAGAAGIVVSNHGGRVLDGTPSTAEVLPAIVDEVGGSTTVLVDGGIRSGLDIFRALALGADGVVVARPYVVATLAAGKEGIAALTAKLGGELEDTMRMCGAASLSDIDRSMIWNR